MDKKDGIEKKCGFMLRVAITVYIVAFFSSAVLRFYAFNYNDMDLAVYDQIFWNILHGSLYSSILGVNFLGHHAHFLAFPLAILYKILPHPVTLLFFQTLALGFGAYPLYLIAKRILNCPWALVVSVSYLLYPGLGYTNAYEFHFTPFATLTILYAIYFFLCDRYRSFIAAVILTLLCQENMSLLVFSFGIYALVLKRSPKWWVPLMVGGTAYFLFCTKFLFPSLNPDTIQFISIYEHWGKSYTEILRNLLTNPAEVLHYITAPRRLFWMFQLFSPLMFVPLLAPLHLLPLAPIFLQHLLSNRGQEINLYFHYTAEMIPFIFLAFIYGIRKVLDFKLINKASPVLPAVILFVACAGVVQFGPHLKLFEKGKVQKDYTDTIKEGFLDNIPADASLVTTFEFMPRISHRGKFFSFHHIYHGYYTLSDKPYKLSDEVDYALIDLNDGLTFGSFYNFTGYKNIQAFLSQQKLVPVGARDNTVLFKKNAQEKINLFEVSQEAPSANNNGDFFSDGHVHLKGFDIVRKGEVLDVKLYWYSAEQTPHDIIELFGFIDDQGRLAHHSFSPACYRIFPSQAWPKGSWVVEHKHISIPPALQNSSFSIELGFYDNVSRNMISDKVLILKRQGE